MQHLTNEELVRALGGKFGDDLTAELVRRVASGEALLSKSSIVAERDQEIACLNDEIKELNAKLETAAVALVALDEWRAKAAAAVA